MLATKSVDLVTTRKPHVAAIKGERRFEEEFAQQNLLEPAGFREVFCDCVAVSVDYEAYKEPQDEKTTEALEKLPGRYWLCGYIGGRPIFKQD